jgi:SAM-dependent methyltransferase
VNVKRRPPTSSPPGQAEINAELWRTGRHVAIYANRRLSPVEVLILVRYREALSGRVLELGCGAGRILGYLVELAREAHGVDISPPMVDYCRRRYPDADVRLGDAAALGGVVEGRFDAILAMSNLIDVFNHAERQRVLGELRERLSPAGLLIFSSHNLESLESGGGTRREPAPAGIVRRSLHRRPRELIDAVGAIPRRRRNRRRLSPLERRAADHAIVNTAEFDYGLLHYYIGPDDQRRALERLGYEVVACLDPDGREIPVGTSTTVDWVHYVARPRGGT